MNRPATFFASGSSLIDFGTLERSSAATVESGVSTLSPVFAPLTPTKARTATPTAAPSTHGRALRHVGLRAPSRRSKTESASALISSDTVDEPPPGSLAASCSGFVNAHAPRPSDRRSEDRRLAPDAPDLAPRVAHLAHRHVRA